MLHKKFSGIGIVALINAIAALGLSVWFSVEWFEYNDHNLFISILKALTFIGFMNLIFEVSLGQCLEAITLSKKWDKHIPAQREQLKKLQPTRWFRGFVIGVLGILLACTIGIYSIYAIVGANYNDFIESHKNDAPLPVPPQLIAKHFKSEISALEEQNKDDQLELSKRQAAVATTLDESTNNRTADTRNNARIDVLTKQMADRTVQIRADSAQEIAAEGAARTSGAFNYGSFFSYISALTGIDPLIVQFVGSAFPTFFLDCISFIGFGLFLYKRPTAQIAGGRTTGTGSTGGA